MKSKLNELNLNQKRILLRADLNVPIDNGTILNEYKLEQLQPTLNHILKNGGTVLLVTHIGRPDKPEPALSTKQLIPWFEKRGYDVVFAQNVADIAKKVKEKHEIILLENIRFFPEEKTKDHSFAKSLADYADIYVNDAFGSLHRDDSSISVVPTFFTQKTIGFLVEKELNQLNNILKDPARPFALIIGGGKVKDKLPILFNLIDKINMVFLTPAIVFSFLKAQGNPVGKSKVDDSALEQCTTFLNTAKAKNIQIFFPIDFQIAMNTFDGPLSYVPANEIPDNAVGMSIGPQTVELFSQELKKAKTILYNGLMGDIKRPETIEGTCGIFKGMAEVNAHTIIAGGDSVAAAQLCNVTDNIDWCSTGGGSTIAYLSGKTLPGLQALATVKE